MARKVIQAILRSNPGGSCPPSPPKYAAVPPFGRMRRILGTPSASTHPVAFAMLVAALLGLSSVGGSVNVSAVGESASLSSSGVNFEITPTSANPNGTVAIGTDELTVSSTCSSGYKLYISTTSNEEGSNTLENTDIEDSSSTTAPTSIPITTGTISSPTLLNAASSKNHWGFAMASGDTGIASTGFDSSTNTTITNNSLFASIPLLDNMSTIRQKTSSADNETVNVYYGVNVGTDLAPGSYSSTVMYTMVMPSPCDYTLMFEDGISDSDPIESEVTKMPESTNIGRNTEVNLGNYISEFAREGYSITGWKNLTDNLTYGKDDTVNINTTNADIIKLAPIWTINNYTVSINTVTGISSVSAKIGSGSGTEVNNVTEAVQYGTTVTISYTESEGYHFAGWEIKNVDTDTEGNPLLEDDDIVQIPSTDTYTFTMPASNVELSPKAEGNKYTVHFNANGGTGTMNDAQMTYGSASTIPENTFTNGDYEFYGWSKTQQDPSTDPTRDYTDGQTGVFNLTTSNPSGTGESTLYAVWKISLVYDDIMQNWTGCTSLAISTTENYENKDTYADLLDTRNNVVYRVRRYNDDACWMAENLRLTPGSSAPTSDVTSGTLTINTSTSEGSGTITYIDAFSTSDYTKLQARYNISQSIYHADTTFFSWNAAAVACPAGWTLPTQAQWENFRLREDIGDSQAGSTKIRSAPYNFNYAGIYSGDQLVGDLSIGAYWTSTVDTSDTNAIYYLYIDNLSVSPTRVSQPKYRGLAARCLQIQQSISMQGFRSDECAALVTSTTENYNNADTYTTRVDTRNNVTYTIRKYSDNLCWITENLRLTPGDSDPGSSTVASGTLTITTSTSQGGGEITYSNTGFSSSVAGTDGLRAHYAGNGVYGPYYTWAASRIVCPVGWTLPTESQYANFLSSENITYSSAGSTAIRANPYNFTYTGYIDNATIRYAASIGYYWTYTQNGSETANNLYIDGSAVQVSGNKKFYGAAVRCLHPSS